MKNNKKNNKLTTSQAKDLEEWKKKIKSGEALEEMKKMAISQNHTIDPEYRLIEIAKEIIPKQNILKKKLSEDELQEISQSAIDYGLENNTSIIDAIDQRYVGLCINLRKKLIREYDIKCASEKALADIIVTSYGRNLSYSKRLQSCCSQGHTTPLLNNFMGIMSKEIDRANRIFLSALETLKHLKQPEMKVNVKTKHAFIAEKQQFNQSKPDEKETINHK